MQSLFRRPCKLLAAGVASLRCLAGAGLLAAACLLPAARAQSVSAAAHATAPDEFVGLTAAERQFLAAHPVLRLGVNNSAPPFSYAEGGVHRGIDADILRRLAATLGVRFEPRLDLSWPQTQAMAERGALDMLALLPATPERAAAFHLTTPVTDVEYALFLRAGRDAAASRDLAGQRVAVVGSFAVRHWLERDYPGVVIVPVASALEALTQLSTGAVDGAVSTVGAASYLIGKNGIVNLRLAQVLYKPPLVIAVRRDWPELATILNKAIATLNARDIDRIKADYVGLRGDGFTREQVWIAALAAGAAGLGGVALVAAIGLRRQRRSAAALAAANQALQAQEERYRQLFENNLDGVLQTRPDGEVLEANRRACELLQMSLAQLRQGGRDAVVDHNDPRLQQLLRARDAQGQVRGDLRMRRGDGSAFEAEIASTLYAGPDGQTLSVLVLRDVTAQRRADAQLRLLEAAVRHLNDVVMITEASPLDAPGPRIVFVNDAFTRITGYARDAVLGRSPRLLQGPRTSRSELDRIGQALRQWQPVRAELVNYARDGREFWLELQIVPLVDAAGTVTHWVSIEREVTERKAAEEARRLLETQLRQAQKMEAIGTLAGGIAHDFNNIVGAILGNAALALQDLPPGHAAATSLQLITRAGQRARGLIEQILAFSRHQPGKPAVQPLAPLLQETAALLRATLPATAALRLALPPQPLLVRGDATQIQQVLMNLCTNAWHALQGSSGHIDVQLQPHEVDAQEAPLLGLPPGRYARVSVHDDGIGMDAATQARIFEPFFTTKKPGEGTGLGLSVVHGIVTDHGGAIRCRSQPGAGTRFDIFLPAVDAAHDATAAHAEQQPPATGRGERVLYIDDDEVMLLMVDRLLHRLNYRARCFADPQAALAALRAAPQDWDVVVSDFNMPGLSGLEVAAAVHQLRPDLPVVISSGFISDRLQADAAALGIAALIHKEATLDELGTVLQRALAVPA